MFAKKANNPPQDITVKPLFATRYVRKKCKNKCLHHKICPPKDMSHQKQNKYILPATGFQIQLALLVPAFVKIIWKE